ncbi:MAG: bifunctional (p)ppGpp synthetase/guanosine-3',5'-bis(diphosphate) 3'-pyrophosphohydrolase [Deltaproteobacteria bacterium]|nr:bifunctional (p)ppGpp synthetase/guanosine-3',5'-bis(diphosphate) 3'-pyrophosphohydrolase [Deltaproteobacteria bacterium]
MKDLKSAVALAFDLHAGQTDKGGAPYILHPLGVLGMLPPSATETERIAAVLHDVVEDCEWDLVMVRDWYGEEVGAAVDALSKRVGESNRAYLARVMSNRSAMIVKLADMEHNGRECRSESLGTSERAYLASLYASQAVRIRAALAADCAT